jgi:hypothetical protein
VATINGGDVSRAALVKLLGDAGASRVTEILGGRRFYVPSPNPDSQGFLRFAEKIGDEEIARKICAEFGEMSVSLPKRLVPLNEDILRLHREMLTKGEIATRLGCTERYVYLVLSHQRPKMA